ncbi:hypothetical protein A3K69_01000 [Candidatus Bathyarchaeota archaeon RBG_16_57_9]|nr:MAG: hypothetical protein A3K69_01000 [Candidatus Bathyarchaeota archaeon RBG_16_57_9]
MNDDVRQMIERIRGVGTNLTFEGGYVADFIERLDRVLEVRDVRLEGPVLKLLVGEPREASQEDLLRVVTKAGLLNVAAAGYEDTEFGMVLYFEYYIPPWSEIHL